MILIVMIENKIAVIVSFYDHEIGKDLTIYGDVEEIKLVQFETNEDSWITLTDPYRTLNIHKVDIIHISDLKKGEERYRKEEENAILNKKTGKVALI